MKEKKMNSYKKMGLIILVSAIAGGILGGLSMTVLYSALGSFHDGVYFLLSQLQQVMLPVMIMITLVTIVYGEVNLRKQKEICNRILQTEDEECDGWEYELEKKSARGTIAIILSQILCVFVLSVGYSLDYIADNVEGMLGTAVIFLICYIYDGFWQVRFVKNTQRAYPEKKGDPASLKFQQQWLESCDEAEKEVIYQSAYKSYIQVSRCIPILLLITMLGHLFFNTGLMAIVVVAVVWLVATLSYVRSCVRLKGSKIGR